MQCLNMGHYNSDSVLRHWVLHLHLSDSKSIVQLGWFVLDGVRNAFGENINFRDQATNLMRY